MDRWIERDYKNSGGKSISGRLDDFQDCYARWKMGSCPCCGSGMYDYEFKGEYVNFKSVAEGVYFCGRCIVNEHHLTDDDFMHNMLKAIADGARQDWKRIRGGE